MTRILICPADRPAVEHLGTIAPLAALPLLGETLVEYWLSHLASSGADHVRLLAHDRPEYVAAIAGSGARWGLQVEVVPEPRELTPAQALIKYASDLSTGHREIEVLDHFPGSLQSLFTSYAELFAGIFEWLPSARTPDRVGVRELQAGVWAGRHTRISPGARLHAPCWLGQNVYIGARAVVGPMAVIEDRAFVESDTEIVSSFVGPDTFVGRLAVLHDSFAWGSGLVNWRTGDRMEVDDAFTLCSLRHARARPQESLLGRLGGLYSRNKDDLQMFWKQLLMNRQE